MVWSKAEETRSLSETWIESGILKVASVRINAINSDAVCITVGDENEFTARVYHYFAGIRVGGNGFRYGG